MSAVTRVKNHVTHTPTFDRARATTRSTVPLHRGDLERWRGYFRQGAGYVQGDSAIRHADGSFSFHGRCVRRSIPQSVGRSIAQAHMGHGIVGPRGTFAPASFSDQLHRSDEVINVGGNRIGTAEIESALLLDCSRQGSPVRPAEQISVLHAFSRNAPVRSHAPRSRLSI